MYTVGSNERDVRQCSEISTPAWLPGLRVSTEPGWGGERWSDGGKGQQTTSKLLRTNAAASNKKTRKQHHPNRNHPLQLRLRLRNRPFPRIKNRAKQCARKCARASSKLWLRGGNTRHLGAAGLLMAAAPDANARSRVSRRCM